MILVQNCEYELHFKKKKIEIYKLSGIKKQKKNNIPKNKNFVLSLKNVLSSRLHSKCKSKMVIMRDSIPTK